MHAIITGHFAAAIEDWRDRLSTFNRPRMVGATNDGEKIMFVSVDHPERLQGVSLSSFEVHPTARSSPDCSRVIEVARTMQRLEGQGNG